MFLPATNSPGVMGIEAELPDDLLAELKQATIDLNVDLIQAVIKRIHEVNTAVADGLADLANNYQYEKILA